ncbi:MAG: formylglycine-generating enzyme family protein [Candidatus Krumholzibacteriota bacterium]|nr:formylglycine-generating enzyme family protein [Candidatus Krumholzibacteriota bacterium]
MESVSIRTGLLVIVALAMFVLIVGCSDDAPTTPDQDEKGTIIIDQTSRTLSGAGWILTGPQNETGSYDTTLTDMPVGVYGLAWNAVSGYLTPSSVPQTLNAAETIIFNGTYTEDSDPPEGFVAIPAGIFMMGSPADEPLRASDETQHQVALTMAFYMLSTEVTNQQYAEMAQWAYDQDPPLVTATTASLRDALDGSTQELLDLDISDWCKISFDGGTFTVDSGKEDHPVAAVTWYGAVAYCEWLSLREGLPRAYDHTTWQCNGNAPYAAIGYRLPTEAEWEYTCRAGTQTPFNTGSCLDAGTEANYNGNYPYTGCPTGSYAGLTVPVGSYPANTFDLYNMHGNVWEWCNDWYGGDYSGDDVTDPVGPSTGSNRMIRGGGLFNYAQSCRSAFRPNNVPSEGGQSVGFRPVRSPL